MAADETRADEERAGEERPKEEVHSWFERFLHSEVSGSIVLLGATLLALAVANSPLADEYFALAHSALGLSWDDVRFEMSLGHWIGDGLMVIFFFVVGLEIKREVLIGELSSVENALLPVAAATGGMVVPALIYLVFNGGTPYSNGWGVPMATDIAFALGILALFGARAPIGLKVFLTALAIADDLGAVIVIALFYTSEIDWSGLALAAGTMALIYGLIRLKIRATWIYIPLMLVVWAGVLASGVHATIAGVALAMLIPVHSGIRPQEFLRRSRDSLAVLEGSKLTRRSVLDERRQADALNDLYEAADAMRPVGFALERSLHPIQAFLILPIFALFKAGIPLSGATLDAFPSPVSLGIIFGLVLGKPIGIVLFSMLAVLGGPAELPRGVTRGQLLGAGCLAGVGFTMSIFISELAFRDPAMIDEVKLGVFVASLTAAALGMAVLHKTLPPRTS